MRRAHRGVWCSKSTPLIEAELFAVQYKRPAPDGRALLCAAPYARKIQGLTASQNLPDARNRAPYPRLAARPKGVAAQRRVWGSQEGAREPYGALAPFCPCRWAPAPPPPGGGNARPAHRQSVSPPAAHRCIGGDQPSAEGKEKRAAYGLPSADGKKKNAPAFEPHPVK